MNVLYGIPNCDTIRKARRWLDTHDVEYRFHDYRKAGINTSMLEAWSDELGWESLLNRRGTTWRKLPEATRDNIDRAQAIKIMIEQPGIIKRPLLDTGDRRILGFNEADYQQFFKQ